MVSLKSVNERFKSVFTLIEGGQGQLRGIIDETAQTDGSATVFTQPNHVVRFSVPTSAVPGLVIRSQFGITYLMAANGPSEGRDGTVWQSFRLFPTTGQYRWQTRTKVTDLVTTLQKDGPLSAGTPIWATLIPVAQEQYDKGMHVNFEQTTFVTNANVQLDDIIDNQNVTKVDKVLGLSVGTLT